MIFSRALAPITMFALTLVGCAQATPLATSEPADQSAPVDAAPSALTVFAAASLTGTFDAIGTAFEQVNPGTTVTFSYDGSSSLVNQIEQGAPADVFASADQATMDKLIAAGLAGGDPVTFAANALTIAVPADNPAGVTSLNDLTTAGVKTVLCAPEVPCGSVAQKVFDAAHVDVKPVSEEQNVTSVLSKVSLGEADAGLVYTTDVTAAGGSVAAVALPDDPSVQAAAVTTYPIVVVRGSSNAATAAAFVAFVQSNAGQRILTDAGFQKADA